MSELGIFYPTIPEGDGDFSTAKITAQLAEGKGYTFYGAFVYSDSEYKEYYTYGTTTLIGGELEEVTLLLYKNSGELIVDGNVILSVISGNAEAGDTGFLIHGDCTISITDNVGD